MRVIYYKLATLTDVVAEEVVSHDNTIVIRRPLEVIEMNPSGIPGQGKQIFVPWLLDAKKDVSVAKEHVVAWSEVDEDFAKQYVDFSKRIFEPQPETIKDPKSKQVH